MDTLKCLNAFFQIAKSGSFSSAARALETTQSNVSKQIAALERELGGPLIERGTRRLALTPAATAFLPSAHAAVNALQQAYEEFGGRRERITGTVRIAASTAFGRLQLIPALPELLEKYPALSIEMRLSDQSLDLAGEEIDLAFRVAHLKDSSLAARRIGYALRQLVAAPRYLARHGSPVHPRDLLGHQCIHFSNIGVPRVWRFVRHGQRIEVPLKGRFEVDSSEAILEAVTHGLGLALLPAWMTQPYVAQGRLVVLLEEWQSRPLPIHVVMLRSRRNIAANRAVREYFAKRLSASFGAVV